MIGLRQIKARIRLAKNAFDTAREHRMDITNRSASTLNRGLRIFFSEFVRVSLRRPGQALFFARTVLWQGAAARLRARHATEGLTVPPIVIFSITNGC